MGRGRPPRTLLERFLPKVRITESCWEWIGALHGKGSYAAIRSPGGRKGKQIPASHAAWFLAHGEWPDKLVLHTCDNPKCVKPSHLFLGTFKDNRQDAIEKGRQTGLTRPEVVWARSRQFVLTQQEIADFLGVNQGAISKLFRGKTHA